MELFSMNLLISYFTLLDFASLFIRTDYSKAYIIGLHIRTFTIVVARPSVTCSLLPSLLCFGHFHLTFVCNFPSTNLISTFNTNTCIPQ